MIYSVTDNMDSLKGAQQYTALLNVLDNRMENLGTADQMDMN
jgi:hypothetical protein